MDSIKVYKVSIIIKMAGQTLKNFQIKIVISDRFEEKQSTTIQSSTEALKKAVLCFEFWNTVSFILDPGTTTTTTTRISSPTLKDSEQEQPVVVPSFVVGDLLWGPAHGCPSWPGKLVEFVDGAEGRVLVKWFGGDKAPSEVELTALQTLSEGLDAHHRARKKCRKWVTYL